MHWHLQYIFHNCFIVSVDGKTLLFDYPSPEFLSQDMRKILLERIRGSELYIFFSHSHGDHFSSTIVELVAAAKATYFVIAKDVAKAYPSLSDHGETWVALPGRKAAIGDLIMEAFPSNDLGVAFLIDMNGETLYFGGDLANWNWENDEEDRRLEAFFRKILDKLTEKSVKVAFANADPRLNNWSGAYEVIERLQPQVFIPMHTFGHTEALKGFASGLPSTSTRVWIYRDSGDTFEFDLQ
jgi:L-ascorbate metabolism protein UlaG (beta-lactamase superfamily)